MSSETADPTPRPAPPETLDEVPQVRALMSTRVVAIVPSAPLMTALRLMVARAVRHLPVMDGGQCVGIVTETDLLRGLAARTGPAGAAALHVADVARAVTAVPESVPLDEAATLMERGGLDALLVADGDGGLVGIVTATDLIHALARHRH
jgi:CBS domain-containing protein